MDEYRQCQSETKLVVQRWRRLLFAIGIATLFMVTAILTIPENSSAATTQHKIELTINYVRQLDKLDYFSSADFYWKVKLGDNAWETSATYTNQVEVDPNPDWLEWTLVSNTVTNVTVKIELWDEDGYNDGRCDISYHPGINSAEFYINPVTGAWWGDDNYVGDTRPGHLSGEEDGSTATDTDDCYLLFGFYIYDVA